MADETTKETRASQDLVEDAWQVNLKKQFDEFSNLFSVQSIAAQSERDKLGSLAFQALNNAVDTANMVAKQAVRHSDVAITQQYALSVDINAVAAAVAEKLAATISPTIPGPSTSPGVKGGA